MANLFDFTVTGDRELTQYFDKLTPEVHDALKGTIENITEELFAQIEGRIPKRTGRLASELTSGIKDTKAEISGFVTFSDEFAKAGALEYGAHGAAKVRPHPMHLTQVFGHLLAAPLLVTVDAYTRQMDIAQREFLRAPFHEEEQHIAQELQETVDRVTGKAG